MALKELLDSIDLTLTQLERRQNAGVFDRTKDVEARQRLAESVDTMRSNHNDALERKQKAMDELRESFRHTVEKKNRQTAELRATYDQRIARMEEQANKTRQALQDTIEGKNELIAELRSAATSPANDKRFEEIRQEFFDLRRRHNILLSKTKSALTQLDAILGDDEKGTDNG